MDGRDTYGEQPDGVDGQLVELVVSHDCGVCVVVCRACGDGVFGASRTEKVLRLRSVKQPTSEADQVETSGGAMWR